MTCPDDEMRFFDEAIRLLGDDVETELASRGWVVADLEVDDNRPLVWFWPPTSPAGFGGLPESSDKTMDRRPEMCGARQTPWLVPTTITKADDVWQVKLGSAIAQVPDEPRRFSTNAELLADLESIEWWPMAVSEAREIQMRRVS